MILGDETCYEHILGLISCDNVTLLGVIIDKSLTFKNMNI